MGGRSKEIRGEALACGRFLSSNVRKETKTKRIGLDGLTLRYLALAQELDQGLAMLEEPSCRLHVAV